LSVIRVSFSREAITNVGAHKRVELHASRTDVGDLLGR
jgi:hypothetical protein